MVSSLHRPMAIFCMLFALLLSVQPMLAEAQNITTEFERSSKRGLIFIPNSNFPEDNLIWIEPGSDLTWYYNYQQSPSAVYENSSLQFVPMLWGAPPSFGDTTFLKNVTAQVNAGANISYVMGFNEPDNTAGTGGSDISPSDAAKYWISNVEPLKQLGLSLGAPAVTGGPSGFTWLANFITACNGGCTFDFIPVHWYGSFDGMASHIAEVLDKYPGKKIWVTEFALDNSDLEATEEFFQQALTYMDHNSNITFYSYFGSFRSFKSNVGYNVSMLNSYGELTDIGDWYLGFNASGVKPDNVTVTPNHTAAAPTPTYTVPPLATNLYRSTAGSLAVHVPSFLGLLALVMIL